MLPFILVMASLISMILIAYWQPSFSKDLAVGISPCPKINRGDYSDLETERREGRNRADPRTLSLKELEERVGDNPLDSSAFSALEESYRNLKSIVAPKS